VREVEARPRPGLEMHDLIGVAHLLDAPHLSPGLRRRLLELAVPIAQEARRTPEDWDGVRAQAAGARAAARVGARRRLAEPLTPSSTT
jgi:hypothetical protein